MAFTLLHNNYAMPQRQKNVFREDVIDNVAHEIRNPLFNIKSFLETLYEYHFQLSDKQMLAFLEIASQETNRLVRLTQRYLSFSRPTLEAFLNVHHFCNKKLISQVVKAYEITILNKEIQLYCKLPSYLPKCLGNSDAITQVLHNLISNSLKFTYPFGTILIELKVITSVSLKERKKKRTIRVSVTDNGIGLIKTCNPYRSHKFTQGISVKGMMNSTGLGLYIVKEIIESHHKSYATLLGKLEKGTNLFFTFRYLS